MNDEVSLWTRLFTSLATGVLRFSHDYAPNCHLSHCSVKIRNTMEVKIIKNIKVENGKNICVWNKEE